MTPTAELKTEDTTKLGISMFSKGSYSGAIELLKCVQWMQHNTSICVEHCMQDGLLKAFYLPMM